MRILKLIPGHFKFQKEHKNRTDGNNNEKQYLENKLSKEKKKQKLWRAVISHILKGHGR